jgi:alpha-1,2-mannosyltransferase
MATTAEGAASWLLSKEPIAIGIFVVYFALIATFSYLVYLSVTENAKLEDLFSGRPFLFIRLAVAALGCTWYCKLSVLAVNRCWAELTHSHD